MSVLLLPRHSVTALLVCHRHAIVLLPALCRPALSPSYDCPVTACHRLSLPVTAPSQPVSHVPSEHGHLLGDLGVLDVDGLRGVVQERRLAEDDEGAEQGDHAEDDQQHPVDHGGDERPVLVLLKSDGPRRRSIDRPAASRPPLQGSVGNALSAIRWTQMAAKVWLREEE